MATVSLSQNGAVVAQTSVAVSTVDPFAVIPPIPPSPYTIPAGATILEDGNYSGLTVSGEVYARNLGKAVINGTVTFLHGSLNGVVVNGIININANSTPGIVRDCWVHAGGAGIGIYVYRPDGLWIERCVVDGFVNVGIRASANSMTDGSIIKRLWDLDLNGGSTGGSTGGTGEVCLWVGHPVTDGVKRVHSVGGYTCCIWRGNAHANTAWEDIYANSSTVGDGTSWYDEHQTTNCTATRVHLISRQDANCLRAYQAEYRASFTVGAVADCTFDHFTVEGGQYGFNFEDAQRPNVTNSRFIGQPQAGIRFFRCVSPTQSGNDGSQLAPGAQLVVIA